MVSVQVEDAPPALRRRGSVVPRVPAGGRNIERRSSHRWISVAAPSITPAFLTPLADYVTLIAFGGSWP